MIAYGCFFPMFLTLSSLWDFCLFVFIYEENLSFLERVSFWKFNIREIIFSQAF